MEGNLNYFSDEKKIQNGWKNSKTTVKFHDLFIEAGFPAQILFHFAYFCHTAIYPVHSFIQASNNRGLKLMQTSVRKLNENFYSQTSLAGPI